LEFTIDELNIMWEGAMHMMEVDMAIDIDNKINEKVSNISIKETSNSEHQ